MNPHYSMVIQWSDVDQTYIVSFPEWEEAGYTSHIHGDSYVEAVRQGQDLLEFLIASARDEGEALPQARAYAAVTPGA